MILLALALLTDPAPAPAAAPAAKPAAAAVKPTTPLAGPASGLVRSELFKRGDKPQTSGSQTFRVDYTASLSWTLADRKSCFFGRCGMVCDMTIHHKTLARELWWIPEHGAPVLAENSPAEREYPGGVVPLGRPCGSLSDREVAKAASDRLRPYQFAEELITDRPLLMKAADDYTAARAALTVP